MVKADLRINQVPSHDKVGRAEGRWRGVELNGDSFFHQGEHSARNQCPRKITTCIESRSRSVGHGQIGELLNAALERIRTDTEYRGQLHDLPRAQRGINSVSREGE